MSQPTGFSMRLSLPRRMMCDFLHFASKVPTVPVQRTMNLAQLSDLRNNSTPRPGWCAIFTKAWGVVCARHPALRRAYLSFPWPRLYQHPINVATVAIERPYGGEDALFFHLLTRPEQKSLVEIDARLSCYKDRPLESAASFRRQLRHASLPRPVRRALWWWSLEANGRHRARFLGTYGVSAYAGLGASSLHPKGLLTTTLNYGTIEPSGRVDVRVVYDHRTLDGGLIARGLAELERVLTHEICLELGYLETLKSA
jgi:hypothetical protein